ncbi:MAG: hypothetical protein R2697_16140 [Ilumatobacteraceae bacterium]
MHLTARLGLTPFAPYHWLMYSKSMWFDVDHARDALEWTPRWSTDEMFAQSYDWYLANAPRPNEPTPAIIAVRRPRAPSDSRRATRIFPLAESTS